jgi:hypothetical protein
MRHWVEAIRRHRSIRWLRYAWWGAGIGAAATAWVAASRWRLRVDDSHAYWAASLTDPYAVIGMGEADAFHYAPPFLWLISPLRILAYDEFRMVWVGLIILSLVWLVGLDLLLPVMLLEPFVADYAAGNINTFTAVAIVLAFRWPALWAFPVLTKVAGGVGILWFAFRGEWRAFAIASGATILALAVSFILVPDQLRTWLQFIVSAPTNIDDAPWFTLPPWPLRVGFAIVLLWWAAGSNRRWVVPLASIIALPVWPFTLAIAAASIRLAREDRVRRPVAVSPTVDATRLVRAPAVVAVEPVRASPFE